MPTYQQYDAFAVPAYGYGPVYGQYWGPRFPAPAYYNAQPPLPMEAPQPPPPPPPESVPSTSLEQLLADTRAERDKLLKDLASAKNRQGSRSRSPARKRARLPLACSSPVRSLGLDYDSDGDAEDMASPDISGEHMDYNMDSSRAQSRTMEHHKPSATDITLRRGLLMARWIKSDQNVDNVKFSDRDEVLCLSHVLFPDTAVCADILANPSSTKAGQWLTADQGAVATTASATLTVAPAGPTDIQGDPDQEHTPSQLRRAKELIMNLLSNGLELTGTKPAPAFIDERRASNPSWHEPLDSEGPSTDQGEKLGWPIHPRIKEVRAKLHEKLQMHAQREKEASASSQKYDRVPDTILPSPGPKYIFWQQEDPGWGDKRARDPHPLQSRKRSTVTVDLEGLRANQKRYKHIIQYQNVVAHTLDIEHALLKECTTPGSKQRKVANDALEAARKALLATIYAATAGVTSHAIFERRLAFSNDSRVDSTLPVEQRVKACLAPIDHADYLFGADRSRLEKDLKSHRDDVQSQINKGHGTRVVVEEKGLYKPASFRSSSSKGKSPNHQAGQGQKQHQTGSSAHNQRGGSRRGRGRGRGGGGRSNRGKENRRPQ